MFFVDGTDAEGLSKAGEALRTVLDETVLKYSCVVVCVTKQDLADPLSLDQVRSLQPL